MDISNAKLIERLRDNTLRNINEPNNSVDVSKLYGVFIPDDNKFIICEEEENYLREFFTGEFIDSIEIRFSKKVYPWRKSGKQYSFNLKGVYFCIDLGDLLYGHTKDGKTHKKDITYLYCIVNEYVRKNPEFIDKLIENEKIR